MDAKINSNNFHFEVEGKVGAPWVTLSHPLACNLSLWDEVVETLCRDFQILRYDVRGHGTSTASRAPYTMSTLVNDAVDLLDYVGVEKTHWVGLSLGGMIGFGLALDHGNRLHSLAACGSRARATAAYATYFQLRIDQSLSQGMAGIAGSTIDRWFTPASIASSLPVIGKVKEMILSTDVAGHAGCCAAIKEISYGSRLHEIAVPTLILSGSEDKAATPSDMGDVAAVISGAKHASIPLAGHLAPVENLAGFMTELLGFLSLAGSSAHENDPLRKEGMCHASK